MQLRLVQAQKSLIKQAKAVGLGITITAFIPFIKTKIRPFLCVKEQSSFNLANCIRRVNPRQVSVAFADLQEYLIPAGIF